MRITPASTTITRNVRMKSLPALVGLFLAACDGDRADQTVNTSALLAPGETRAGKITSEAAAIGGPASESEIGDYKIYNDRVAFVIHNEKPSDGYIQNGGALIDADLVRPAGEPGQDMIKEYSPVVGLLRLQNVQSVRVVDPGGAGKAAVIETDGTDGVVEIGSVLGGVGGGAIGSILDALELNRPHNLKMRTRYTLEPSKNYLRIETFLKNGDSEHWPRPIELINILTSLQSLPTLLSPARRESLKRAVTTLAGKDGLEKTAGDAIIFTDHAADPYMMGVGFDRDRITNIEGVLGLFTGSDNPSNSTKMFGAVGERHEVAYGLFLPDERTISLLVGPGLTGDFMMFGGFEAEVELEPGEEKSYVRFIAVGQDMAEINASRLELAPSVPYGSINGVVRAQGSGSTVSGARVHVSDSAGSYQTMAVTDTNGTFDIPLPAGDWTLQAAGEGEGEDIIYPSGYSFVTRLADGHAAGDPVNVSVISAGAVSQALLVQDAAKVQGTLRDGDGTPIPGKLTFQYAEIPTKTDEEKARDARLWIQTPYDHTKKVVWTTDGAYKVGIAPGEYVVTASLGFEYETDVRSVTIESNETLQLDFTLKRVYDLVDLSGGTRYVSIDSHRHAAPSNHGETRSEDSIITNVAEGLFSFASSDHDIVTDYHPLLKELNVENLIAAFNSVEISTAGIAEVNGEFKSFSGHFNPFPVVLLPDEVNDGAPIWWQGGWSPSKIFQFARDTLRAKIVQINHGGEDGYFCWYGYNPATDEASSPDYSDNYDVLEIINGKSRDNWLSELSIWYGHLNHGRKVTGTGVSDSHHRIPEPGYGRTYVGVPMDVTVPAAFTGDLLARGLISQNVVVSGGPFIRFGTADGLKGMGETATGATVRLKFEVLAPLWMGPLDFRVNANGLSVITQESLVGCTQDETSITRYSCEFDASPSIDSWYNVETRTASTAPQTLDPVYPGAIPFSVSGPIYVDVTGDGWTAPLVTPELRGKSGKVCE